ncbi:copper resistance protein C [Paractinoplanes abujensis]|uniref:Copper transport protein n=1 Tax=Paractinoplanes abujensis TaxID=882441 RepID=A0A7W7CNY8_9ACTN|nr:copper resistance protein CopC [Actinoplanes abujensis]MBB4692068.1 copper transport protein [Actinoplanes abujensis]GID16516.1 copper resistance protein C [Actinoplanes abujensis]
MRKSALLAVCLLALAGWWPAQPAFAHAVLSAASPQQGSVVPAAPERVVLRFSENVQVVPGRSQVIGPDGKRISEGDPEITAEGLVIKVRPAERPLGTYLVSYRIISADSHPVSGAYTFSVGAPSENAPTAPVEEVAQSVQTATAVTKWLGYAGLSLALGPVLVLALWWPRRLSRAGPVRLARGGLALIAAATLAGLWLQAPASSGAGLFDVAPAELRQVLSSDFGLTLSARLALLAIAAALVGRLRRAAGGRPALLLAALTAGILVTWPLTGHPAAGPQAWLLIVADTAHLAAMSVWLGGLVALAVFLLRRAETRELRLILPAWSRWAAFAVYWLVAAGAIQALIQLGTLDALFSSTYGRLILLKTGLLAVVLAVAFVSRRLVQRGIAAATPARLRRAVGLELAITVLVLAASAVLVQTTTGRTVDVEAVAAQRSRGFVETLNSRLYAVQFEIFPATVGEYNTLHAFAYTPEGKPLKVLEWKVSVSLPAQGVEAIDAPVATVVDNQGLGAVTFPIAGDWQLSMTLRVSEIDQATVTTTVPVR